jgi:hypothetical protein
VVAVCSLNAFAGEPLGFCLQEKLGRCEEHVKKNDSSDARSCQQVKGVWTAKQACPAEDRVFSCDMKDGRISRYYKKFLKIGGTREDMKEQCDGFKGTFTDEAAK